MVAIERMMASPFVRAPLRENSPDMAQPEGMRTWPSLKFSDITQYLPFPLFYILNKESAKAQAKKAPMEAGFSSSGKPVSMNAFVHCPTV